MLSVDSPKASIYQLKSWRWLTQYPNYYELFVKSVVHERGLPTSSESPTYGTGTD